MTGTIVLCGCPLGEVPYSRRSMDEDDVYIHGRLPICGGYEHHVFSRAEETQSLSNRMKHDVADNRLHGRAFLAESVN